MDVLHKVLVALHLLGMAAVVGGWIAVRSARTVTPVVVWGARAQLVTGLLLVGFASRTRPTTRGQQHEDRGQARHRPRRRRRGRDRCGRVRRGEGRRHLLDIAGGAAVAPCSSPPSGDSLGVVDASPGLRRPTGSTGAEAEMRWNAGVLAGLLIGLVWIVAAVVLVVIGRRRRLSSTDPGAGNVGIIGVFLGVVGALTWFATLLLAVVPG